MSEISETVRDQLDPELGESSDGEGDVEIEHLGDDGVEVQVDNVGNPPIGATFTTSPLDDARSSNQSITLEIDHLGDEVQEENVDNPPPIGATYSAASPLDEARSSNQSITMDMKNITLDIRKRTLITFAQRTILEDLYRNGMNSASLQLHHLHALAAERTGLDLTVVKNWIRNRRRPTAVKSAERMVEKLASSGSPSMPTIPATLTQTLPMPTLTSVTVPVPPALTTAVFASHSSAEGSTLTMPDPKRVCLEPGMAASSVHHFHLSPSSSSSSSTPFLVKVRVGGSGDSDFVEVEVPSMTYPTLLRACCEELEISVSDVVKIRKLPNVWVRKDRDVQRMREGQELEIILKNDRIGGGSHMTSMLTVNPFPSGTTLPILNLQSIARSDAESSLIAALGSEVPSDIHSNSLHQ